MAVYEQYNNVQLVYVTSILYAEYLTVEQTSAKASQKPSVVIALGWLLLHFLAELPGGVEIQLSTEQHA